MLIYLINFISIPLYNLIIKNKMFFIGLVSFQLFLILALRSDTLGPDLISYHSMYQYIGTLSWSDLFSRLHFISRTELTSLMDIEGGYAVLNWLMYQLGFSYHGFLVICALFSIAPVGLFIYRYSLNPCLSFLIYISTNLYFYNFGILRQSLAIGFLLCAVPFILKKRWFFTGILFALAFTFHRVSLLWIPVCLLFLFPITNKWFLVFCGIAGLLLGIFSITGTSFLGPLLSMFGKTSYMVNEFTANNMIILLFITAFLLYTVCDINVLSKIPIYNLLICGLIICMYFEAVCTFTPLARALPVVLIFIVVLLPNMLYQTRYYLALEKTTLLRFAITNSLSVFLFIYMILSLRSNPYIIPYEFY